MNISNRAMYNVPRMCKQHSIMCVIILMNNSKSDVLRTETSEGTNNDACSVLRGWMSKHETLHGGISGFKDWGTYSLSRIPIIFHSESDVTGVLIKFLYLVGVCPFTIYYAFETTRKKLNSKNIIAFKVKVAPEIILLEK